MTVNHLKPHTYYDVWVYRTGFHANDAYSAYLEMGRPHELTTAQIAQLNNLTRDLPEKDQIVRAGKDGTVDLTLPMNSNDIVLVKVLDCGPQVRLDRFR